MQKLKLSKDLSLLPANAAQREREKNQLKILSVEVVSIF